jgi:type IV pilus assembly protein PilW
MDRSAYSKRARGLTLIELMVALAISAILGLIVFITLGFGFRQDADNSTLAQMNDNARAALTLLTRDLQSAGFMLSMAQPHCQLTLTYDSKQSGYATQAPVWAASQASGTALPLQTTAPGYGSGYGQQALMMTSAPSIPQFVANSMPPLSVVQFGTTQSGNGQGAMNSTQLPISTNQLIGSQALNIGDIAYLAVPMNGGIVCLRIPIVNNNASTGQGATYIKSAPSSLMPSTGYTGYSAQIPSTFGSLTNSNLIHSQLIDIGSATDTLEIQQYWINQSSGQTFPVLQRSTYDALNDSLISQQAIAPGAVSLQALFGVIPATATIGQTAPTWKTWGDVGPTDQLVEVALALVMRTLQADPQYTAPKTITVPQPGSGLVAPDAFVDYTPSAAEAHHHFAVYVTQVWLRNVATNTVSSASGGGTSGDGGTGSDG